MADYQRILSYLYRYEKTEKRECLGFVKAEQREGSVKLTIQIDDERLSQGMELKLCFYEKQKEGWQVWQLDTFVTQEHKEELHQIYSSEQLPAGFRIKGQSGVFLYYQDSFYYGSVWIGEEIPVEVLNPLRWHKVDSAKTEEKLENKAQEKVLNKDAVQENAMTKESSPENVVAEDAVQEKIMTKELSPENVVAEDSAQQNIIIKESLQENVISEDAVQQNIMMKGSPQVNVATEEVLTKNSVHLAKRMEQEEIKEEEVQIDQKIDCVPDEENGSVEQNSAEDNFQQGYTKRNAQKENISEEDFQEQKDENSIIITESQPEKISDIADIDENIGDNETDDNANNSIDNTPHSTEPHINVNDIGNDINNDTDIEETIFAEEDSPVDSFEKMWINSVKERTPVNNIFNTAFYEGYRVSVMELKNFGKEAGTLVSNQFLLKGYERYKHLLAGKVRYAGEERYCVGVPGIYENREKYMAEIYQFPVFLSLTENRMKTGSFGYWLHLLENRA